MHFIGYQEKVELESLILEELGKYFDLNGAEAMLQPGLAITVSGRGVAIVPPGLDASGSLAFVEVRTLFTAVCHINDGGGAPLPRGALKTLAAEGANATAQQINKISSTPRARP